MSDAAATGASEPEAYNPRAMTPLQAARFLGVSERTLGRYRERGLLAYWSPPGGSIVRYDESDLETFRRSWRRPARVKGMGG